MRFVLLLTTALVFCSKLRSKTQNSFTFTYGHRNMHERTRQTSKNSKPFSRQLAGWTLVRWPAHLVPISRISIPPAQMQRSKLKMKKKNKSHYLWSLSFWPETPLSPARQTREKMKWNAYQRKSAMLWSNVCLLATNARSVSSLRFLSPTRAHIKHMRDSGAAQRQQT